MDLSKIISVSGKPGLYRVVAQGRQAVIAESLIDGKRIPVHATLRVSSLDEISMFTTGEDVALKDILVKLHEVEKGKRSLDPKGDEEKLWSKLAEVLPEMDRERIYTSDLRKFFGWYNMLVKSGEFEAKEEEKKEAEKGAPKKKAKKEADGKAAPKKKAAVKKKAPAKPAASRAKTTTVRKGSQRGG